MDRLPRELVEEIILVFAHMASKNDVLDKRLVCRHFNRLLRPLACRTLQLDTTRLNKYSRFPKPRPEALQTIGYRCRALHIDMMVLRDEYEVFTLNDFLKDLPNTENFRLALRRRYSFGQSSFTESEFLHTIAEILLYCRNVERARICLPSPIVGGQCGVATRVIANALKALALRPEDDSAPLTTLVVENVTDHTLCELWTNPTDVRNMQTVLPALETLVLTVRRRITPAFPTGMFGVSLWNVVYHSARLKSLCLTQSYVSNCGEGGPEVANFSEIGFARWLEQGFPGPVPTDLPTPRPTHLELKNISIMADELLRIATKFGPWLEELYLDNVLLMTQQSATENVLSDKHLWVGLPNQEPGQRQWMAMRFRALMPRLRTCRCSHLSYKLFVEGTAPSCKEFDLADPAGLGRPVSQRFVEVVTGVQQPPLLSGGSTIFYPHDAEFDGLLHELRERKRRLRISEHDYHAHKLTAADQLPDYQYSIDGLFRNCSTNSVKELQYIADRVYEGVNAVHADATDGVANIVNTMPDLLTNSALAG